MMYEDISRCHEVFVYKKIKVIHGIWLGGRKFLYNSYTFLFNSFHQKTPKSVKIENQIDQPSSYAQKGKGNNH